MDIVKTWPSFMEPEKVGRIFAQRWARFYFSLGRGRPKREISSIWFTHRGRLIGSFPIEQIVKFDGRNIPELRSLEDRDSAWQFIPGVHVAVCVPPCQWIDGEVFHESFRGWRYFDLAEYRETTDAHVNLEARP